VQEQDYEDRNLSNCRCFVLSGMAGAAGAATTTNPAERRAFKEEYRRGGCKIERKWDDDEYKEEIKCKRRARPIYGYYRY